jgi:hypothetical protein
MEPSELAFFTTQELIAELVRRKRFLGVIIQSVNEYRREEWGKERVFKVHFNSNLDAAQAARLLDTVAGSRCAHRRAGENGCQSTPGDSTPDGRQHTRRDAKTPQRADACARGRTDAGACRSLLALVADRLGALHRFAATGRHTNLVLSETQTPQFIHGLLCAGWVFKHADCDGTFS